MRILSRQRDYYDWVAAYGVDPSLCYVRQPLTVRYAEAPAFARFSLPYPQEHRVRDGELRTGGLTFGVFPRIYRRRTIALRRDDGGFQLRVFSDVAEIAADLTEMGVRATRWERRALYDDEFLSDSPWPNARWRALGSPIFVAGELGYSGPQPRLDLPIETGLVTLDPILQDFRFTEVDATDVFQRIQNFLRLDPDPAPEFSDAQKLQAHGFDQRSFRKRRDEES